MRIVLVAAVLVGVVACAKGDPKPDSTAATPVVTPTVSSMAVNIVSPADGDTVSPNVEVVLAAEGVTIEKATGTRVDGFGHFHLFLDAAPGADNEVIAPNSDHIVHMGSGVSTYTYSALPPGRHEVIAVAGYGDHALMTTRRDTVRFIVK